MPRPLKIWELAENAYFAIGGRTAVIVDRNESEAKVRIVTGLDAGKILGWSLGTEIDRVLSGPPPVPTTLAPGEELVCPVCRRVCTSKPGFTLHMKGHPAWVKNQKRQTVMAEAGPDVADLTAASAPATDGLERGIA